MDEQENLAQLNDRLQAKNHALAQALTRAGEELAKAKAQLEQFPATAHLRSDAAVDRCSTDSRRAARMPRQPPRAAVAPPSTPPACARMTLPSTRTWSTFTTAARGAPLTNCSTTAAHRSDASGARTVVERAGTCDARISGATA